MRIRRPVMNALQPMDAAKFAGRDDSLAVEARGRKNQWRLQPALDKLRDGGGRRSEARCRGYALVVAAVASSTEI